jgi:hypothetical protein
MNIQSAEENIQEVNYGMLEGISSKEWGTEILDIV